MTAEFEINKAVEALIARGAIIKIIRILACCAALVLCAAGAAFATGRDYCEVHGKADPELCSYEPTTFGYTKDSDDSSFLDFTISVRYQLFPIVLTRLQNYLPGDPGNDSALYFAFTGRFGQYIGSRDSSPVVEKLFNPKVFYRYWTDHETHQNHVDLAFAHESNGQSIDSQAEYEAALATGQNQGEVKDQMSRGWDYWEMSWQKTYEPDLSTAETATTPCEGDACADADPDAACQQACHDCRSCRGINGKKAKQTSIVSNLAMKYFLPHGPLEGAQENYNSWENDPEGKRLDRVSGLSARLQWTERDVLGLSAISLAMRYETGVRDTFRYNTYRLEIGTKVFQLPMSLWWQTGYNSDLAQYYKKVNSYGVQAAIGSF